MLIATLSFPVSVTSRHLCRLYQDTGSAQVDEDGTTPHWKGYRGLFTRVPRRKILCGLEISLRDNATTYNYTPQNLPHTNSPMVHHHQFPNGNLNHTN
jgi:hypothetical protein